MLLHNQLPPQRDHEQHAQPSADQRQHEDPRVLQIEAQKHQRRQRKNHARGNRLPRIPVVCTMLFSRIEARPNARRMLIDNTEIGIDAATVSPARRPTYTVTAPKMMPKTEPSNNARTVNSGGF